MPNTRFFLEDTEIDNHPNNIILIHDGKIFDLLEMACGRKRISKQNFNTIVTNRNAIVRQVCSFVTNLDNESFTRLFWIIKHFYLLEDQEIEGVYQGDRNDDEDYTNMAEEEIEREREQWLSDYDVNFTFKFSLYTSFSVFISLYQKSRERDIVTVPFRCGFV